MDTLAMLVSLCALYISVLTLMRNKAAFLMKSGVGLLVIIFFKPIFLWGIAGGFRRIYHLQIAISVIVILSFLVCLAFKKHIRLSDFGLDFWAMTFFILYPLLAQVCHCLVGRHWMNAVFLSEDLPMYIQLLSSKYKITFETFRLMSEYYVLTLFFLFVIYQIIVLTGALFCVLHDCIVHHNFEHYIIAPSFLCPNQLIPLAITIALLPTNFLISGLSKILSYFL